MAASVFRASRALSSAKPSAMMDTFSNWYIKASGYREYGLRSEDLIREELPGVKEALRRMPQEYLDERFFRIKRAMQASLLHAPLPKELHTPELEDTKTLVEMIKITQMELEEKKAFDEGNKLN